MIATRLANARGELQKIGDYKYALVNDVLDQAAAEMRAMVLTERGEAGTEARRWRRLPDEAILSAAGGGAEELWRACRCGFEHRIPIPARDAFRRTIR